MRIQNTPFGSHPFKRGVAIVIAALFLFTGIVNATPSAFARSVNTQVQGGDLSKDLSRLVRDAEIRIPPELGLIDESFRGASGKTILFIQDAHDSLEAQENIAKIINHLVSGYGVQTVFEEGYEGPVPTDKYFGFIKDPRIKEKVSWFFMDHLRLGGAEYAHINRTKDFSLVGADSLKLHKENVDQYRLSASKKDAITKDLKSLEKELKSLVDSRFPKELKEWLKTKEQFDAKKLDLFTYLGRTMPLFVEPSNITRHREESRRDDVAIFAGKDKIASPAIDLWRARNDVAGAAVPLLQFILDAMKTQDPAVIEKAKHIDACEVFGELIKLEQAVAETYLHNEGDKQLLEYYKILSLLNRLNDLQVSQEEYEAVKVSLKAFDTDSFARFIFSQAPKTLILSRMWERNIKDAVRFYEIAAERDGAISRALDQYFLGGRVQGAVDRKIQRQGNRSPAPYTLNPDVSVLVYGGFHKEAIKRILEAKGISYLVVSPRITKPSSRHEQFYKRLMTDGKLPFELPANIRIAVRAENRIVGWNANTDLAKAEFRTLIPVAEKISNREDFSLAAEQAMKAFRSEAGKESRAIRGQPKHRSSVAGPDVTRRLTGKEDPLFPAWNRRLQSLPPELRARSGFPWQILKTNFRRLLEVGMAFARSFLAHAVIMVQLFAMALSAGETDIFKTTSAPQTEETRLFKATPWPLSSSPVPEIIPSVDLAATYVKYIARPIQTAIQEFYDTYVSVDANGVAQPKGISKEAYLAEYSALKSRIAIEPIFTVFSKMKLNGWMSAGDAAKYEALFDAGDWSRNLDLIWEYFARSGYVFWAIPYESGGLPLPYYDLRPVRAIEPVTIRLVLGDAKPQDVSFHLYRLAPSLTVTPRTLDRRLELNESSLIAIGFGSQVILREDIFKGDLSSNVKKYRYRVEQNPSVGRGQFPGIYAFIWPYRGIEATLYAKGLYQEGIKPNQTDAELSERFRNIALRIGLAHEAVHINDGRSGVLPDVSKTDRMVQELRGFLGSVLSEPRLSLLETRVRFAQAADYEDGTYVNAYHGQDGLFLRNRLLYWFGKDGAVQRTYGIKFSEADQMRLKSTDQFCSLPSALQMKLVYEFRQLSGEDLVRLYQKVWAEISGPRESNPVYLSKDMEKLPRLREDRLIPVLIGATLSTGAFLFMAALFIRKISHAIISRKSGRRLISQPIVLGAAPAVDTVTDKRDGGVKGAHRSEMRDFGLDAIPNYVTAQFGVPVRLTDELVKAYFGEKVLRDSQRDGRVFFMRKIDSKKDIHFLEEWKQELQSDGEWLQAREAKGDSQELIKQHFPYFGYISDLAVGVISQVGRQEKLEGFVGFEGGMEGFDVQKKKWTFHLAIPQIEIHYKNIGRSGRIKGVADLLMDTLISIANNPDLMVTGGIRFNAMTPGSRAFAKRRGFEPGSGEERILLQASVQHEAERIAMVIPSGIMGRSEVRNAQDETNPRQSEEWLAEFPTNKAKLEEILRLSYAIALAKNSLQGSILNQDMLADPLHVLSNILQDWVDAIQSLQDQEVKWNLHYTRLQPSLKSLKAWQEAWTEEQEARRFLAKREALKIQVQKAEEVGVSALAKQPLKIDLSVLEAAYKQEDIQSAMSRGSQLCALIANAYPKFTTLVNAMTRSEVRDSATAEPSQPNIPTPVTPEIVSVAARPETRVQPSVPPAMEQALKNSTTNTRSEVRNDRQLAEVLVRVGRVEIESESGDIFEFRYNPIIYIGSKLEEGFYQLQVWHRREMVGHYDVNGDTAGYSFEAQQPSTGTKNPRNLRHKKAIEVDEPYRNIGIGTALRTLALHISQIRGYEQFWHYNSKGKTYVDDLKGKVPLPILILAISESQSKPGPIGPASLDFVPRAEMRTPKTGTQKEQPAPPIGSVGREEKVKAISAKEVTLPDYRDASCDVLRKQMEKRFEKASTTESTAALSDLMSYMDQEVARLTAAKKPTHFNRLLAGAEITAEVIAEHLAKLDGIEGLVTTLEGVSGMTFGSNKVKVALLNSINDLAKKRAVPDEIAERLGVVASKIEFDKDEWFDRNAIIIGVGHVIGKSSIAKLCRIGKETGKNNRFVHCGFAASLWGREKFSPADARQLIEYFSPVLAEVLTSGKTGDLETRNTLLSTFAILHRRTENFPEMLNAPTVAMLVTALSSKEIDDDLRKDLNEICSRAHVDVSNLSPINKIGILLGRHFNALAPSLPASETELKEVARQLEVITKTAASAEILELLEIGAYGFNDLGWIETVLDRTGAFSLAVLGTPVSTMSKKELKAIVTDPASKLESKISPASSTDYTTIHRLGIVALVAANSKSRETAKKRLLSIANDKKIGIVRFFAYAFCLAAGSVDRATVIKEAFSAVRSLYGSFDAWAVIEDKLKVGFPSEENNKRVASLLLTVLFGMARQNKVLLDDKILLAESAKIISVARFVRSAGYNIADSGYNISNRAFERTAVYGFKICAHEIGHNLKTWQGITVGSLALDEYYADWQWWAFAGDVLSHASVERSAPVRDFEYIVDAKATFMLAASSADNGRMEDTHGLGELEHVAARAREYLLMHSVPKVPDVDKNVILQQIVKAMAESNRKISFRAAADIHQALCESVAQRGTVTQDRVEALVKEAKLASVEPDSVVLSWNYFQKIKANDHKPVKIGDIFSSLPITYEAETGSNDARSEMRENLTSAENASSSVQEDLWHAPQVLQVEGTFRRISAIAQKQVGATGGAAGRRDASLKIGNEDQLLLQNGFEKAGIIRSGEGNLQVFRDTVTGLRIIQKKALNRTVDIAMFVRYVQGLRDTDKARDFYVPTFILTGENWVDATYYYELDLRGQDDSPLAEQLGYVTLWDMEKGIFAAGEGPNSEQFIPDYSPIYGVYDQLRTIARQMHTDGLNHNHLHPLNILVHPRTKHLVIIDWTELRFNVEGNRFAAEDLLRVYTETTSPVPQLYGADLKGRDLTTQLMEQVRLWFSDLTRATLPSYLADTMFTHCVLRDVKFSEEGVYLTHSGFYNVDLRGAKNSDKIRQEGSVAFMNVLVDIETAKVLADRFKVFFTPVFMDGKIVWLGSNQLAFSTMQGAGLPIPQWYEDLFRPLDDWLGEAEPMILKDNTYAAHLRTLLLGKFVAEQSVSWREVLRDMGSKIQQAVDDIFSDHHVKIGFSARGPMLQGFYTAPRLFDFDFMILDGLWGVGLVLDSNAQTRIQSSVKAHLASKWIRIEKPFAMWNYSIFAQEEKDFLRKASSIRPEDMSPDYLAAIFFPNTYGEAALVEKIRRNIIIFLSTADVGQLSWQKVQQSFAKKLRLSWRTVKLEGHMFHWYMRRGFDVSSEIGLKAVNNRRMREVGLPDLAEMQKIYKIQEAVPNSPRLDLPERSELRIKTETQKAIMKTLATVPAQGIAVQNSRAPAAERQVPVTPNIKISEPANNRWSSPIMRTMSVAQTVNPSRILPLDQVVIMVVEQARIDALSPEMFKELLEITGLNNGKLHLVIPDALQGKYSERVAELRKVASVYYGFPRFAASEKIPVIGFSDMEHDTLAAFQGRLDPRLAQRMKDSAFGLNQAGSFGVGILYALKDIPPDQLLPNRNGFRHDATGRYLPQVLEILQAYTVISTSA